MRLKFKKIMLYLTVLVVLSSTANAQTTFLVCNSVGAIPLVGDMAIHVSVNPQIRTVTLHYGTEPEIFTNARIDDNLIIAVGSAHRMGFSLFSQISDTAELKISRFHGSAQVQIWGRRNVEESECLRLHLSAGGTMSSASECFQPRVQRTFGFVCERARPIF